MCKNSPNSFCYICGKYTPSTYCQKISSKVNTAYKYYFNCTVGDQDKLWASHICCNACKTQLLQWEANENTFCCTNGLGEQTDHATDCHFWLTSIKGFSWKNKSKVVYPNCNSALELVPYGNNLPAYESEEGIGGCSTKNQL